MAEFCLECWNRLNKTKKKPEDVTLTRYLDLCEGCGEMKQVIQALVPAAKYRHDFALFYLIRWIFVFIWNAISKVVYHFKRRNR